MPSDFIDRAKLEALANERSPHLSGVSKFLAVETFMAGVDATLALLDVETTEEWSVYDGQMGKVRDNIEMNERSARNYERNFSYDGSKAVSRRVARTPWLPSEGGEKL